MTDHKLIEYYRARASEYEQIYYREVPARRREIDEEADFLRQHVDHCTVLELACGTGYWTEIMAVSASHIFAADIAPEMLKETGKKNLRGKVDLIRFDINHPSVKPDLFDRIVLGFWFSHHPRQNYTQLFDNLIRLIKPGGSIWMIDNNPPAEGPAVNSERIDRFGNNFKYRNLDNGVRHSILKNYFSADELSDIFDPTFLIERLNYRKYYWSVILKPKK